LLAGKQLHWCAVLIHRRPTARRPESTDTPPGGTLRSMAPSAFLPAMIYEIGNGAAAPVIAITALDLGASPKEAGLLLALLGIGQVLGDMPSSWLADRLGDRRAMVVAAAVAMAAWFTGMRASSPVLLGVALTVVGMANATFYLARQSYLSEVVPSALRARAMSTLGGAHRVGLFIGPFVGAAAIGVGGLRAAYLVAIAAAAAAATLLLVIPDLDRASDRPPVVRGKVRPARMFADHRRLFLTLGTAVLAVGAVRAARQTVLPLWSQHIGLDPQTTSVVFGIASAVDMALFYPSGKVMDLFGRLSIALPSMLVLGSSMMLLPLTRGVVSLTLVAMFMSFGNGIGSGIMMTLGTDVSPADNRTSFLSVWRTFSDTGNAAGPAVVSAVALAWTLPAGIVAVGFTGLFAAAGLALWAPRYSEYATRGTASRRLVAVRADASPH
jgi:predicted MFS family arabinose efflux permease